MQKLANFQKLTLIHWLSSPTLWEDNQQHNIDLLSLWVQTGLGGHQWRELSNPHNSLSTWTMIPLARAFLYFPQVYSFSHRQFYKAPPMFFWRFRQRPNHILNHIFESSADHWGTLEKASPIGNFHGYQRFMRCRYSSASGGYGLLVPSDRAVKCRFHKVVYK